MTLRRARLVVADDDPVLLDMLVLLLDEMGYDVVATAPDGSEAVRAVVRLVPDLLLMDLRMPVMTGIQACVVLQDAMPDLPVVLLSAYDDAGLQSAAAAAGVQHYLVKGCSARSIAAVLDAVLAARTAVAAGPG